jgi:hypothetical protein
LGATEFLSKRQVKERGRLSLQQAVVAHRIPDFPYNWFTVGNNLSLLSIRA